MWSRLKKRFFGGSRKTADDAASLDEATAHACSLADADDVRRTRSRQTLSQFAKDDLVASAAADRGGGGGGKLRRKLSWFGGGGARSQRRTNKSTTSLNAAADKRRSGDDAVLAAAARTAAPESAAELAPPTSAASDPAATAAGTTAATGGADGVVALASSRTSPSLFGVDRSLVASRDDVWCSRGGVEFSAADKGTFGAASTSRIEELQRPVSLPPVASDARASPPRLKRRAKAASQSDSTESRKSRLSQHLPEPPDELSSEPNPPSTAMTTSSQVPVTSSSSVDAGAAADTTEHLKSTNPPSVPAAGRRVPPPVPVRKYLPPAAAEHPASGKAGPAATTPAETAAAADETAASPSPTRDSPAAADSGSDDTEGKESGYVTLDDLQAQLMRSSWSSDERDVSDALSNRAALAASLAGTVYNRLHCCAPPNIWALLITISVRVIGQRQCRGVAGSRVISVLDSGAKLLRVAGVTAGLAESNGSLPSGL